MFAQLQFARQALDKLDKCSWSLSENVLIRTVPSKPTTPVMNRRHVSVTYVTLFATFGQTTKIAESLADML